MPLPCEELDKRVQEVNRFRSDLVNQMRSAAERLLSPGIVPDEDLDTSIRDYGHQVQGLQADLGLKSSDEGSLWEAIDQRVELARRAEVAIQSISSVHHLRVASGDPALLRPIQVLAGEVQQQLATAPWEQLELLQDVEQNLHPLCRLTQLLQAPEALTDEVWNREISLIQEQFGVPVSTAIARGRIQWTDPTHRSTP